jgi:hypothetical protein
MSWYITELALYHKEFIPVRPSIMARSALALSRCILGRSQPRFSDWSGRYDPQVVLNLSNFLTQPSQALLRKYSSPYLSSVSTTIDTFLQRQAMEAERAMQNQNNELRPMEIERPVPTVATYLDPQTPQKNGYHSVPIGVLTPPITPDKDIVGNNAYTMAQGIMARPPVVCTPTPPPSEDHAQHIYIQQPTYVQQPQSVVS